MSAGSSPVTRTKKEGGLVPPSFLVCVMGYVGSVQDARKLPIIASSVHLAPSGARISCPGARAKSLNWHIKLG